MQREAGTQTARGGRQLRTGLLILHAEAEPAPLEGPRFRRHHFGYDVGDGLLVFVVIVRRKSGGPGWKATRSEWSCGICAWNLCRRWQGTKTSDGNQANDDEGETKLPDGSHHS